MCFTVCTYVKKWYTLNSKPGYWLFPVYLITTVQWMNCNEYKCFMNKKYFNKNTSKFYVCIYLLK